VVYVEASAWDIVEDAAAAGPKTFKVLADDALAVATQAQLPDLLSADTSPPLYRKSRPSLANIVSFRQLSQRTIRITNGMSNWAVPMSREAAPSGGIQSVDSKSVARTLDCILA
jgi:hypothetical protein